MPSANPRINTVLERPVYMAIRSLARREGLSLSEMVRRLVHEALELREDAALEALVERRARTSAPLVPHEEVKRRFLGPCRRSRAVRKKKLSRPGNSAPPVTGRPILRLPGMEPGGTEVPEDGRSMPVRPVQEQAPERAEAFREALEETSRLWGDMLRRLSRK
jgi:hypothetical protein